MSYPLRIVTLTMVLGVAILVTSCGTSSSGDSGSFDVSPSAGGGTESGPPPLPESSPPPTVSLVPITPAPGRRERVAQWHLVRQSGGGRLLLIDVAIGGPPCDAVTGIDIAETATTVKLTVHAGRLTSADCPSGAVGSLATARMEARLARPLGKRELLGGIL